MKLKELLQLREKPFNKRQTELITKAYNFAKKAHVNQKRKSGEEYFEHCVQTAAMLIKMGLGSITTAAGLLHDAPEDTSITLEEIEKEFGKEIAFIVDGVTKVGRIRLRGNTKEYYLNNLRRMFLAMAADIRVVLIKIADRLHNMETLRVLSPDKRKRIALETQEIFVPIANRLGIGEIKGRLEDLSFKYLEPKEYEQTKKIVSEAYRERKKYVDRAIKELKEELKKEEIKVLDIHGRAKHYYSSYKKLKKHEMDISKIYDLAAIRIVVPSIADCYETLGIVHKKYKPLIGRIKDYISLPKPNGYQSIHSTIFGPEGKILEVQIRTKKMHDAAEYGIAAHWVYSENRNWKDFLLGSSNKPKVPENELVWVKQLRSWHEENIEKDEDFWASLKIDFFEDHIFAFTPRGDVIDLPENATPIDFAYSIHSEVGDRTIGAKADGKIVPLSYSIKNGQVIEILTTKNKKVPNRDWLKFAKTAQAKSKIRSSLRRAGLD